MQSRWMGVALGLGMLVAAPGVGAQQGLGGAAALDPSAAAMASAAPSAGDGGGLSCRDDWPEERARPRLSESFPVRGISGHVAWLELKLEHLQGEYVFPAGIESLHLGDDSADEREALKSAFFVFPSDHSEVRPSLERKEQASGASTSVRIPLIPVPKDAGRFELTLPPLPVAVSRASGQVHTICTQPHVITVEDPLASDTQPNPHADPEPRSQIEVWTSLRDAVFVLAWALPLAALAAFLAYYYRDRWRRVPPPPPPISPWTRAREQLKEIEHSGFLQQEQFEVYLDRVSDTLREYLGGRYGFDGLESTTREILRQVSYQALALSDEQEVRTILQRADLVKFARRIPSEEECRDAMRMTIRIIDHTVPAPSLDPRSGASDKSKESGNV